MEPFESHAVNIFERLHTFLVAVDGMPIGEPRNVADADWGSDRENSLEAWCEKLWLALHEKKFLDKL